MIKAVRFCACHRCRLPLYPLPPTDRTRRSMSLPNQLGIGDPSGCSDSGLDYWRASDCPGTGAGRKSSASRSIDTPGVIEVHAYLPECALRAARMTSARCRMIPGRESPELGADMSPPETRKTSIHELTSLSLFLDCISRARAGVGLRGRRADLALSVTGPVGDRL